MDAPRRSIDEIVADARRRFERVRPEDIERECQAGAILVDIRPSEQRSRDGAIPGACVIDRNVLEWRLDPASEHRIREVASYTARLIIVCNEGYSSSLAAATLLDLGLHRATDLEGGFQAWRTWRAAAPTRVAGAAGPQPRSASAH